MTNEEEEIEKENRKKLQKLIRGERIEPFPHDNLNYYYTYEEMVFENLSSLPLRIQNSLVKILAQKITLAKLRFDQACKAQINPPVFGKETHFWWPLFEVPEDMKAKFEEIRRKQLAK